MPRALLLLPLLCLSCATPRVEPWVVGGDDGLTLSWEGDDDAVEVLVDGERRAPVQEGELARVRVDGCARDVRFVRAGLTQRVPALPCPTADRVRFTFLTDTQSDPALAGRFAKRALANGSSFVVHSGDIVQNGGVRAQWRALFHEMGEARALPLFAAVGNHEYWFDPGGEEIGRYLDKPAVDDTWYRITVGPVEIILLNTAIVEQREQNWAQVAWLQRELQKLDEEGSERWRVVAFHHPPWSQSFAHADWYWRKEWRAVQAYYVPLFEQHAVDLVLNGHSHLFERAAAGEIEYVVGGAAGGIMGLPGSDRAPSAHAERTRTVSHVEADADRLRVVTETLDGEVVDEIVLDRPRIARRN